MTQWQTIEMPVMALLAFQPCQIWLRRL